jgi:hypothetical protein
MQMPYEYQPLDPLKKQIRLLRLDASSTSHHIACNLERFELEIAARDGFRALSYTWGPDTPTHHILIDGKSFRIRENLYQYLRTIASQDRGSTECIWIDQICINQIDDNERTQQVSIMTDIYRLARDVKIWLGPEDVCIFPLRYTSSAGGT